jgi:hypothetical protein
MLLWNLVACYFTAMDMGLRKNKHCRKIKFTREMYLAVGLRHFWIDVADISALVSIVRRGRKIAKGD